MTTDEWTHRLRRVHQRQCACAVAIPSDVQCKTGPMLCEVARKLIMSRNAISCKLGVLVTADKEREKERGKEREKEKDGGNESVSAGALEEAMFALWDGSSDSYETFVETKLAAYHNCVFRMGVYITRLQVIQLLEAWFPTHDAVPLEQAIWGRWRQSLGPYDAFAQLAISTHQADPDQLIQLAHHFSYKIFETSKNNFLQFYAAQQNAIDNAKRTTRRCENPKCGKNAVHTIPVTDRSGDEPQSIYFYCQECGTSGRERG